MPLSQHDLDILKADAAEKLFIYLSSVFQTSLKVTNELADDNQRLRPLITKISIKLEEAAIRNNSKKQKGVTKPSFTHQAIGYLANMLKRKQEGLDNIISDKLISVTRLKNRLITETLQESDKKLLQKKIEDLQKEILDISMARIKTLDAECKMRVAEAETVVKCLGELKRINKKIESMEKSIDTQRQKNYELNKQLHEKKNKIEELVKKLEGGNQERQKMKARNDALEEQKKKYNTDLTLKTVRINALKKNYEKMILQQSEEEPTVEAKKDDVNLFAKENDLDYNDENTDDSDDGTDDDEDSDSESESEGSDEDSDSENTQKTKASGLDPADGENEYEF